MTLGGIVLGGIALGSFQRAAFPYAEQTVKDILSIGDDYGNGKFLDPLDARSPDQAELNDLLSSAPDVTLNDVSRIDKDAHINPEDLTEFVFMLDKPGPVHVTFDGLEGNDVSLTVLKVTVDDDEPFYAPIVRGPNKEVPAEIQLGVYDDGEHRLDISLAYSTSPVAPEEIIPNLVQGEPGTTRSYIDLHQPDIYFRDYGNIAHNIPLHSLVFVYETDDALALIYWTECLGEDLTYGFGTPPKQLITTKNRPTDWDWTLEALVNKKDGRLLLADIAVPYHTRETYEISESYTSHPALREASPNNNVEAVKNSSLLKEPKFRPRPQPYIPDAKHTVLYNTGKDTATLSLRAHYKRGDINLNSAQIRNYLDSMGIDPASLRD